jgi:hypothetical protein
VPGVNGKSGFQALQANRRKNPSMLKILHMPAQVANADQHAERKGNKTRGGLGGDVFVSAAHFRVENGFVIPFAWPTHTPKIA